MPTIMPSTAATIPTRRRINLAAGWLAALALGACTVQVNQTSGFDPCNPNPCQTKGVCGGWSATCSVKTNAAVCGTWSWTAKTAKPTGVDGKALTKPAGYEGAELSCDGVDNDCDGQTDEGVVADPAKVCAAGGVCAGAKPALLCLGGKWLCGYAEVLAFEASETSCDGKDNDCDGQTDEQVIAKPTDCKRQGVCAGLAAPTCAGATGFNCGYEAAGDYQAAETSCDGLDNDCDGQIDTNLAAAALIGKATCKANGVCASGSEIVCSGGIAVCSYAKVAGFEQVELSCDGKDNDCDGQTDTYVGSDLPLHATDTVGCQTKGVCSAKGAVVKICKAGLFSCDYAKAQGYEANELQCDGKDNNCDGQIDNIATKPALAACGTVGVCADGPLTCKSNLWQCDWPGMTAKGYESFEQSCDGKDNDCDGATDESASAALNCLQAGVCQWGVEATCAVGKAKCDYSHVQGFEEVTETVCDGLDNDCDGKTDEAEALNGSKAGCVVGVCKGVATTTCEKGKWLCDTKAVVGYEDVEKTCDGKDNDCDGQTDEFLTDASACPSQGLCVAGVSAVCVNGKYLCNFTAILGFEAVESTCDGKDNDCDGKIDAGLCGPAATCSGGDQCASGACKALFGGSSKVCANASTQCAATSSGKVVLVDDGAALCATSATQQTCSAGTLAEAKACPADKPACSSGLCVVCTPNAKTCDGKDKTKVIQCSADGLTAQPAATCAGGEKCAGAGDCVPVAGYTLSDSTDAVVAHELVALTGGGFAAIWAINAGNVGELRVRVFSAAGVAKAVSSIGHGASKPIKDAKLAAAAVGSGFAVAWETQSDGKDIALGIFDANGKAIGTPVLANDPDTAGDQGEPAMSVAGGLIHIAFSGENIDFLGFGIGLRSFDATGKPTATANLVVNDSQSVTDGADGDQTQPAIVCKITGECAIAYTHVAANGKGKIRARILSADGQLADAVATVSTGTVAQDQRTPTLAWVGATLLVAWSAEGVETGPGYGIALRPLTATLTPLNGAAVTLANEAATGNQGQPQLREVGTGAALVWGVPGLGSVRDFAASGAAVGAEATFAVNTTATIAVQARLTVLIDGKQLLQFLSDSKGTAAAVSQGLFR
ncbi:MAG: hypothetical protein EXR77_19225 [Myxococcales bacterium]|nr:hypothetical protein [Myxococcales bacterium]